MKTLIALLTCLAAHAQQFTKDGLLIRPDNYREWVFLSSGLGMTYGPASQGARDESPRFDNVFVIPSAYKAFVETGKWPDKTIFVLEVRASASKGSINTAGHYQDQIVAIEAEVKDKGNWGFFGFGTSPAPAKQLPANSVCNSCHAKNAAVDNTFVQFYPTLLPIAKAKGTLK